MKSAQDSKGHVVQTVQHYHSLDHLGQVLLVKIKVVVVVMLMVLVMVIVVIVMVVMDMVVMVMVVVEVVSVMVKIMVMVLGTVWSFFCLMATIAQVLVTMVSMHTGKEKRRNDGSNI